MSGDSTHGARLSIFTWSVYLLAVGAGLFLVPDRLLDLLGIEPATEVWIQVVGVVALVAGAYYLGGAIHRARWLYWYSVPVRILSGVALAVLAVTDDVWQLWIFAALDIAGAGWTFVSLRWKPAPEPLEPSAPA